MDLLESLNWRFATKRYQADKKVSQEDIEKIKESIRLAPTSYGLQLFKVVILEDMATREKLVEAANNQPQIKEASHLFLFCNHIGDLHDDVDAFIDLKLKVRDADPEKAKSYGQTMKNNISGFSDKEKRAWTSKQTYITLGHALIACAQLRIDSTPMEGFDKEKFNEILDLNSKGLEASVLMAVGYRSDEDPIKDAPKIRKSKEDLFLNI